ncbi:hypothetical protein D3C77_409800 [compost metagenome]
MQVLGAMVQELLHQLMGAWICYMLEVVDNQKQFFVDGCCALDNCCNHFIDQLLARALERHAAVQGDAQALQGATQIGEEYRQVRIIGTQRQPCHLRPGAHHDLAPLSQQRSFTKAWTAGNQAYPAL